MPTLGVIENCYNVNDLFRYLDRVGVPSQELRMSRWQLMAMNVIVGLACALARPAWSNGDTFFQSTEIPGSPEYVIFGSVKDDQGNFLNRASVTVNVAEHMLAVTTQTDILGRFRAPDVGREIHDLGYQVDPSLITVTVEYPGYHIAHREYRGRYQQSKGAIEMNFVMEKNQAK
jgi:hypothetical protein